MEVRLSLTFYGRHAKRKPTIPGAGARSLRFPRSIFRDSSDRIGEGKEKIGRVQDERGHQSN